MKYCSSCNEKFDDSLSFCPTDGEVLEEDPSALTGKVLDGQYQIEALLGKGGMGAVYRARHILLGDRVAIKVLPPDINRSEVGFAVEETKDGLIVRGAGLAPFAGPQAGSLCGIRTGEKAHVAGFGRTRSAGRATVDSRCNHPVHELSVKGGVARGQSAPHDDF